MPPPSVSLLSLATPALMLLCRGPGKLSLDHLLWPPLRASGRSAEGVAAAPARGQGAPPPACSFGFGPFCGVRGSNLHK